MTVLSTFAGSAFLVVFASASLIAQSNMSLSDRPSTPIPSELRRSDRVSIATNPSTFRPFQSSEPMAEKKNVGLAVIYSLLLPGMGEMYAGRYETGKYFTIAEGVLLVTLLSFDRAGAWLRDDARRFAVQHAQLNGTSQSDQFYIDIGNDSSVYAFNERILRSRDVSRIYDTDPASPSYWRWETDQQRATYRSIRVSSDRWFNNTRFVVAAIGANHIISAINAARSVISHNKDFDGALGSLSIRADVIGGLSTPDGIRVSITKQF